MRTAPPLYDPVSLVDFTVTYGYDANGNRINETGPAPLSASLSSASSFAQLTMPSSGGTENLSSAVTETAQNGQAPYTYAWTLVSGSGISVTGGTIGTFASTCSNVSGCDYTATFKVTVTDASNTTVSNTVAVEHKYLAAAPSVAVNPSSSFTQATLAASGASQTLSASVAATVSNGQGPFTYQWASVSGYGFTIVGATTAAPTFTSTCSSGPTTGCDDSGVYSVTVTDSLGRTASAQVAVEQKFLAAAPTVTVNPSSSYTQTTLPASGTAQTLSASVAAAVTNGAAPFTYQWTSISGYAFTVTGGTTASPTFASNCSASPAIGCDDIGTYQVGVTDALGRTATASVTVEQKYLAATPTVAVGPGGTYTQMTLPATGGTQTLSSTLSAAVTNGQAPFIYQWTAVSGFAFTVTGATTASPTFASSCSASPAVGCDDIGNYQVGVTDALGRTASATVTVEQKYYTAVPTASVALASGTPIETTMPVTGTGTLTSTLTATVTNGQQPFSYSWSVPNGSPFTIAGGSTPSSSPNANVSSSCTNASSGCSYSGTVQVTVTDAVGRAVVAQIVLSQAYLPSINLSTPAVNTTQVTMPANGGAQTTVTALVTGGRAPYTYQWAQVSGYAFTASGLTTASPTFSSTCTNMTAGCNNIGVYQLTVTDAHGQTATGQANITQVFLPPVPTISVGSTGTFTQMTLPATQGTQSLSASVTATVAAGQGPFTYRWSSVSGSAFTVTGGTTSAPTFASACTTGPATGCDQVGTYQVTVTDALNRTAEAQVTIEQKYLAALPTVAIGSSGTFSQMTLPSSSGTQSLSSPVTATITNGQGPFTYQWSSVSGYAFSVTNGTTNQATFGSSCATGPATGCDQVGIYKVTVTDALGRTASAQATIEQKYLAAVPTVSINPTSGFTQMTLPSTAGTQSLSAAFTATVTNGQGPFTYQWSSVSGYAFSVSNGTTSAATLGSSCASGPATGCDQIGTYEITVTDALGRTATAQVGVEQKYLAAVPSVAISPGSSFVQTTMPASGGTSQSAAVTASVTNGQGPFTYQWSLSSGFGFTVANGTTNAPTFSSSCSASPASGCDDVGTYQVTVTDALGRTAIAQVSVEQKYLSAVPTVAINPTNSFVQTTMPVSGSASLSATPIASVTNGQAPFTYQWSLVSGYGFSIGNGTTSAPVFSSTCSASPAVGCNDTGTYQLTVTDAYGRTATAQVSVQQQYLTAVPTIGISPGSSFSQTTMPASGGTSLSAAVTASVTNGQAPFSYQWGLVSGYGFSVTNGTTNTPTFASTCSASPATGCDDVGTYEVVVTDGYGRTASAQISVEQKYLTAVPTVVISPSSSLSQMTMPVSGTVALQAILTASVINGQAPFSYQWSQVSSGALFVTNGSTNQVTFTSFCGTSTGCDYPTVYQVTVTDAYGRTGAAQVSVEQRFNPAPPMSVSISGNLDPSSGAAGTVTAAATATPANGVAPFTYQWALSNVSNLHSTGSLSAATSQTAQISATCGKTACNSSGVITVTVHDSAGRTASAQANYDISIDGSGQ